MKKGLERIIGKNIVSVVVNQKRGQVFLVFSETSFEFYGWPREVSIGGAILIMRGWMSYRHISAQGETMPPLSNSAVRCPIFLNQHAFRPVPAIHRWRVAAKQKV